MSLPLMTIDEARAAFLASTARVLDSVSHPPRTLARLIAGATTRAELRASERLVVAAHRGLLAHLDTLGYRWVIDAEIDGIGDVLLNPAYGTATIRELLPPVDQPVDLLEQEAV